METKQKNYKTPIPVLEKPFENIALAFSGGGFRAAAFALGTLSYLDELKLEDETPLLQKVTYLSSASGGTIATAMYSLYSAQGHSFGKFYKDLFENLEGVKLMEKALKTLNDKKEWKNRPDKRRNLINAFAIAYDEFLFAQNNLSSLVNSGKTHLEEVCFNATSFYHGLLFRQAVKLKDDPKAKTDKDFLFGNFIVHLHHGEAANLKLADLLAASSCFPAGFEPIVFPDDFINAQANRDQLISALSIGLQAVSHDELERLYSENQINEALKLYPGAKPIEKFVEEIKKNTLKPGFRFGLMDGGITDNQGTESLIRANERRLRNETDFKPFDFMMINDVGSHFMNPYEVPEKVKTQGFSIVTLMVIAVLAALAGLTLMIYGIMHPAQTVWTVIGEFAGLILFLAGTIFLTAVFSVKKIIRGKLRNGKGLDLQKNFSEKIVSLFFRFFGSAPVMILLSMVNERINSVLKLNNDVFLKRIRYLLYEQFFEAQKWTQRVKSNHIYDLTFTNDTNRVENDSFSLTPNAPMQQVAEAAFEMETTLWFDTKSREEFKQAAIIATGQFTTCYNLLEYTIRLRNSPVYNTLKPQYQDRVNYLQKKLTNDYNDFKKDPFRLYNQSGKNFGISNFKDGLATDYKIPGDFIGLR